MLRRPWDFVGLGPSSLDPVPHLVEDDVLLDEFHELRGIPVRARDGKKLVPVYDLDLVLVILEADDGELLVLIRRDNREVLATDTENRLHLP